MSLELFVRGLYTRTAVARHPCFSWAFLLGGGPLAIVTTAQCIRLLVQSHYGHGAPAVRWWYSGFTQRLACHSTLLKSLLTKSLQKISHQRKGPIIN